MRQADEYEAAYMADGGHVVHREKISFPRWFRYLIGFTILAAILSGVGASIVAQAWLPALFQAALIPLMFFFTLLLSTLRVTVTNTEVLVQYGTFGPRIPLDRIELCEAEDYSLWKYGGYGIRYSIIERAWCYNMLGDKGKAVRIHYRTDSGGLKRVLVASADNVALANAINRARGATSAEPDLANEVVFAEEFSGDQHNVEVSEEAHVEA